MLARSVIYATVWIRPAASSLPNEDVHDAPAWLQVDDEFSMNVWLIHSCYVVVGVKISMGVVGSDIPVDCLPIFNLYLRRDPLVVLLVVACRLSFCWVHVQKQQ